MTTPIETGGLSVAELVAQLTAVEDQSVPVAIGWSWTTAPIDKCEFDGGNVTIEAMLTKGSRMKGFYALCIEDLERAVKVLDAALTKESRSKSVDEAIKTAQWRIGHLLEARK